MCVSLSSRQQKTMQAGTQCQQKTRLESFHAPADLIYMVNILYSWVAITFIKKSTAFLGTSLCVVMLATTFSTVASEHPRTYEENSTNRKSIRGSDRPGARHQVSVPHVGHQPHPVRQLPTGGHTGERRTVRAGAGGGTLQTDTATSLRRAITWADFVWCIWSDWFRLGRQRFIVLKMLHW